MRPTEFISATRSSFTSRALVASLVASSALVAPCLAQSEHTANPDSTALEIEVVVAHGRNAPGTRAESLREFAALFRAPFSAYASLVELSRTTSPVSITTPLVLALPNGRRLQVALQGQDPDGKYRLRVSINRAQGAPYLPLLQVRAAAAEPFFVAGQEFQDGTLIVCIRIRPRAR